MLIKGLFIHSFKFQQHGAYLSFKASAIDNVLENGFKVVEIDGDELLLVMQISNDLQELGRDSSGDCDGDDLGFG